MSNDTAKPSLTCCICQNTPGYGDIVDGTHKRHEGVFAIQVVDRVLA